MGRLWRDYSILIGVAVVVLFVNLGGPPLWDRDEPRNAACAREMMQRGDWVVPTFNEELRVLKPALIYWLIISAYQVFGVTAFAARFWSALLALGTVLLTYHIGRRLFNAQVGRWSALILCTNLLFITAGRLAKVDSPLIFFSTLALLIYVSASFRSKSSPQNESAPRYFPRSWWTAALVYAAVGMAVMSKGLVGLVLPIAVIGMFLLIKRLPALSSANQSSGWTGWLWNLLRPFAPLHFLRTCWFMRPITALLVIFAVAGPWYILVGIQTEGEFLRGFFLEHHFHRAAKSMEGHSGPFLLYYLFVICISFLPWSVFLIPTLLMMAMQIRQRHPWRDGYIFAACWAGVYVVLFSCAQTKLPSYITPCYPALALLTGGFMYHWTTRQLTLAAIWPKVSLYCLAFAGFGILIGFAIAARIYFPGDEYLGLAGLVFVAGATAGLWFMKKGRLRAAGVSVAIAAATFTTVFFGGVLMRVAAHQQQQVLFAAVKDRSQHPVLGSYGCHEPSWVFYTEKPIPSLTPDPVSLSSDTAPHWAAKRAINVVDFFQRGRDRFIITTEKNWRSHLKNLLPEEAAVVAECPWFLRRERLLLVGHSSSDSKGK